MPALARSATEILPLDDCHRLLDASRIGRVAFLSAGAPLILPVNFRWHRRSVVFRTAAGAKLHAALAGQAFGFEIDAWDDQLHTGWSVVVTGRAEEVVDPAATAELDALGLRPWAARPHDDRWVRIHAEEITGRRLGGR
jgi:uncharacterized protein